MRLHLGVVDVPYANVARDVNLPRVPVARLKKDGTPRKARPKKHGPFLPGSHVHAGEETTGDVAEWLENKYHVMGVFGFLNLDRISGYLADAAAGALETALMGGPPAVDPLASAGPKIEQRFREFIDHGEMEHFGFAGVPTKAALEGTSPRFKKGHGPRRPSFQFSGLYENSFRAWIVR